MAWLVAVALSGCTEYPFEEPVQADQPAIPVGMSGEEVPDLPLATVFFTDPYGRTGESPDRTIAAAIDDARESIQMAMYNFSLENVSDALLRAHKRGIEVQVVLDSNTIDSVQAQRLADAGITVVGDNRRESMHNKFIVIDGYQVWTGSLNMTYGGTYNDHNNIVRLVDSRINLNYRTEFEEMFEYGYFGANSPSNTPFPRITRDNTIIEVYFSPDDGVRAQVIPLIQSAQESVNVLAFSLTADGIADALLNKARDGVDVRAVLDAEQVVSNIGGKYDYLKDAGLDVRLDALDGLMHHKVIVVDNQAVLFGSYNFSNNAENKNDENVVIVYDDSLAGQFNQEFEMIYNQSIP
jgi:phosphatidylserine/phosphatidylglycerophosphate/cardiolipin synthase-like enzyme